jgi:hypothetical protein
MTARWQKVFSVATLCGAFFVNGCENLKIGATLVDDRPATHAAPALPSVLALR